MISSSPRRLILLLLAVLLFPSTGGRHDGGDLVNAVIGNVTADSRYGETTRVRMHLEAVAQRLAEADASSLTAALQRARSQNIERLRAYARAGQFPRKPASVPWRTPNFVDDRGVVCAVGYLLEQDCGYAVVIEVARAHQLDYLPYIDSPVLTEWRETSGLSLLELAMIQPSYGDPPPPGEWPTTTWSSPSGGWDNDDAAEAVLILTNLAASIINFGFAADGTGNVPMGLVGMLLGGASLVVGLNDNRDALTATGAMSGVLGLAGLIVAQAQPPDESRTVSAHPFVGEIAGKHNVGLMACVRF
jgi:hypothetical protein